MATEVIPVGAAVDATDAVRRAAQMLAEGAVVAFPTETVYGVGARADRPDAVARLRKLKSRPADRAFTVHIGSCSCASSFAPSIPGRAKRLMRKSWPGPLTVILPVLDPSKAPIAGRVDAAAMRAVYHENSVGLRCPDHPVALALLSDAGGPVVAASANRAGAQPPYDGQAVVAELDGMIDLLLDAGPTRFRRPSSIVRFHDTGVEMLREGVLDQGIIERLGVVQILFVCTGNTCRSPMAAGVARKMFAERLDCAPTGLGDRGVDVRSAGTAGGFAGATEHAVDVMKERGIDISQHRSVAVSDEAVRQADYVFAMTRSHVKTLERLVPSASGRIRLLLDDEDVTDPVGGSREAYERCAAKIEQGIRERLAEIDL